MKNFAMRALAIILFCLVACQIARAAGRGFLKAQVEKAKNATDEERNVLNAEWVNFRPTAEDVDEIVEIWKMKKWDEDLFIEASNAVQKIDKPELAERLIPIMKKDKKRIAKICKQEGADEDDREAFCRYTFAMFVLQSFQALKVKKAVPVLREYLNIKELQYYASEALAAIGDTESSDKTREIVDQGGGVNYAGRGKHETLKVIRDLLDETKRSKWDNLAPQLMYIEDPAAKPDLVKLFSHEDETVRLHAAETFARLSDDSDTAAILEMAKNADFSVRYNAVRAMGAGHAKEYEDVLINLLITDPKSSVRGGAAGVLGGKNIVRAVPALEKALNDHELMVRDAVFIALVRLTGKKYDYQGRRAVYENMADNLLKTNKIKGQKPH